MIGCFQTGPTLLLLSFQFSVVKSENQGGRMTSLKSNQSKNVSTYAEISCRAVKTIVNYSFFILVHKT